MSAGVAQYTLRYLVKNHDFIAVEDLNIKGLARTRLSKSALDAAWGQFVTILEAVAVKRGIRVQRDRVIFFPN